MQKFSVLVFLLLACLAMNAQQGAPRMVLLEEFTQASCGPCAAANPALNAILAANTDKVVSVKYQTNWPGTDPMNTQTQTWVGPRVTYYAVQGVPDAYLDGQGGYPPLSQSAINTASAILSPFTINIAHQYNSDNSEVTLTIVVTAVQDISNFTNLKLHTALVEDEINFASPPGSNGETEFYSVMRKMLPNSTGTTLPATWTAGQAETITLTTTIPNYIYDPYEMSIVCFVQQNNTAKTVHQAAKHEIDPVFVLDAAANVINNAPEGVACVEGGVFSGFEPTVTIENLGQEAISSIAFNILLGTTSLATYTWTGAIATGASANITLPAVTISSSGILNIQVTSVNGSNDQWAPNNTTSAPINLTNASGLPTPITQNYTATAFPPAGWNILNPDGDATWVRATQGNGNTGSAKMDFYSIQSGTDEMFMPTADLNSTSSATLTFDVAYAPYTDPSYVDELHVYVSINCGTAWEEVYFKAGSELATATASGSAYTPTSSQWRTETVDLSSYVGNDILVKFTAISGYGNNLYVDNVNINAVAGCAAPTADLTSVNASDGLNNGSVTASASGGVPPYTYNWNMGATTSTVSGLGAGTYCVVITDSAGCSTEECVTVTNIVGIESPNANGFVLYSQPNPANDNALIVVGGITEAMTMHITDLAGRIVQTHEVTPGQNIAINTSAMSEGTYLCQLTQSNRVVAVHKLAVIH